jgi:hypothetical protein
MFPRSMSATLLILALLVCCHTPAPAQPEDEPVESAGVVISVDGEAVVDRAGDRQPVTEGFVLENGDVILVKTGGKCTGFTPAGEPFRLDGPAELRLPASIEHGLLDKVSRWIREQLTQWVGQTRRRPLVTRTLLRDWDVVIDTPTQLIPAPNGRVRSTEAEFYWATVPGIDSYLVTIVTADGEEMSRLVRDHGIVLNDLEPGGEYVWKVQPSVEGWHGETRWRTFTVMTPEEERTLDEAIAGLGGLEAGVLLLTAGLHDEAIYKFDATISSNEDRAPSARRWRAQALADIGLYREAYQDVIQGQGVE